MSSYEKLLANFGQQQPVEVKTSWKAKVTVHPITVSMYVEAISGEEKYLYGMLSAAVDVDGDYWTADQWANLPKQAMADVTLIINTMKEINGENEDLEKK